MKMKILQLAFLFLLVSVITSSRENSPANTKSETVTCKNTCPATGNEYAVNTICKKAALVKEIEKTEAEATAADNELPLTPISRFILLQ